MAQKIAFFTELFKLDEDEEEIEDPEDAAVILRQFKPVRQPLRSEKRMFHGCKTSSSLVNVSAVEASSSLTQQRPSPVNVSDSCRPVKTVKSAKVALRRKGKRKRSESLELLPDSQQIFKGLEFCTFAQ